MRRLMGFLRPDGRWGFRDHILVLPLHTALCDLADEAAGRLGEDVVVVRHEWDQPAAHADTERVRRAFLGFAVHPNVGSVLVLGIGAETDGFAEALHDAGKPSAVLRLDACGSFDVMALAAWDSLVRLAQTHDPAVRREAPLSSLCLGLECGSSDAFSGITANPALGVASDILVAGGGTSILAETSELLGAEHLLAQRAVTQEIGRQVVAMVQRFEIDVARHGVDLLGSQPAPGNILGGLTTIEEKSLGAARKGGTAPISGVLDYAEAPAGHGLYIMDTPGQDIEQMVAMVAAGAQIVAFTTGRGTPTGSPIAPCLKISSNSEVAHELPDLIDIDTGGILAGTATLSAVGDEILDLIIAVASGAQTSAERRGNREFALSQIRPMGL